MDNLLDEIIKLAKSVGHYIKEELERVSEQDIEEKELNSLVSYVDKNAEIKLVARLKELIPDSSFITEEQTVEQSEGEYQWILDPLDGTNNFLHKIPHFAVSIALREKGEMKIGVVYHIMQDECFYASKGGGAFLNDKAIKVSQVMTLEQSLIATGFPYANNLNTEPLIDCIRHWIKNTRGVRRFGAAALDLCFVACGRIDCYYETAINIWDIAAGVLIVEEAGGQVTDLVGGDDHLMSGSLISSNTLIHDQVQEVINKSYGV